MRKEHYRGYALCRNEMNCIVSISVFPHFQNDVRHLLIMSSPTEAYAPVDVGVQNVSLFHSSVLALTPVQLCTCYISILMKCLSGILATILPSTESQSHPDYHQDCKQVGGHWWLTGQPSRWGRRGLIVLPSQLGEFSPVRKASLVSPTMLALEVVMAC